MCWNSTVSMNTFLVSCFAIILALINGYNYKWMIALFCFVSIQLMEYFIWKNLKNDKWNDFFTKMIQFNIFIQPFALTFLISNHKIQNIYHVILFIYAICAFIVFNSSTAKLTTVSNNGHLTWNWMQDYKLLLPFYYFFYSVFLLEKMYFVFLLTFITFIFSLYSFYKDKTFSSMWCWTINIVGICLIIKIMFFDVLPCKFFKNINNKYNAQE